MILYFSLLEFNNCYYLGNLNLLYYYMFFCIIKYVLFFLIGNIIFFGVDFSGIFFVNIEVDDDYVGFIFSFQDSFKFYCIMWKKFVQIYWYFILFCVVVELGIQLKFVNFKIGFGEYF